MNYDLLYARMLDEIAQSSPAIPADDLDWAAVELSWAEIAQLHVEVVV